MLAGSVIQLCLMSKGSAEAWRLCQMPVGSVMSYGFVRRQSALYDVWRVCKASVDYTWKLGTYCRLRHGFRTKVATFAWSEKCPTLILNNKLLKANGCICPIFTQENGLKTFRYLRHAALSVYCDNIISILSTYSLNSQISAKNVQLMK